MGGGSGVARSVVVAFALVVVVVLAVIVAGQIVGAPTRNENGVADDVARCGGDHRFLFELQAVLIAGGWDRGVTGGWPPPESSRRQYRLIGSLSSPFRDLWAVPATRCAESALVGPPQPDAGCQPNIRVVR